MWNSHFGSFFWEILGISQILYSNTYTSSREKYFERRRKMMIPSTVSKVKMICLKCWYLILGMYFCARESISLLYILDIRITRITSSNLRVINFARTSEFQRKFNIYWYPVPITCSDLIGLHWSLRA